MNTNKKTQSDLSYKPDIDGLRAIAVFLVIAFHAFPKSLPGGYIGVDIFFVISGFLISRIIFSSFEKNNFDYKYFLTRRVRRIFPALLVVLGSCLIFGFFFLTPKELSLLGKHTAAGISFVSNFIFWRESGYFDILGETKPLLHLWSLAIEEQFYIIFPLLILVLYKLKINYLIILILIYLISFYINVTSINHDPVATFYHPSTRFWELLTGSILAYLKLYTHEKFIALSWLKDLFSTVGCLLIIISIIILNKSTPYPGWMALMPTIGAALIISSSNSYINKKILSNSIVVWFGLISYSLYLWHWPLLSFARIIESNTPSNEIRFIAILLAILLATITYYLIEKPIRSRKSVSSFFLISAGIITASIGFACYKDNGFTARFNKTPLEINHGAYKCNHDQQSIKNLGEPCIFGNLSSKNIVLIFGDSHAGHLTNALNDTFGTKYKFVFFGHGHCFMTDDDTRPSCIKFKEELNKFKYQKIYAVIRSQWWHNNGAIDEQSIKKIITHTIKTAEEFNPQKLIIVGTVPTVNAECEFANYYVSHRRKKCEINVDSIKYNELFIKVTQSLILPSNVKFIYPYNKLCYLSNCTILKDNISFYNVDGSHLTSDGALLVMPDFDKILN